MIAELQKQVGELAKKAKEAQAACGVTPADLKTDLFSAPQPLGGATASSAPPSSTTYETGTPQLVFKSVPSGGAAPSTASKATPSSSHTFSGPSRTEAETAAAVATEPAQGTAKSEPISSASSSTTSAKVLTVNRKFNFVVINQGLQDGLKMGDKLKVFKQGQEIATIQVEKLYDKFSAATLVEEDPKNQVVEGDEIRKA